MIPSLDKSREKADQDKTDDPRAGADVGKIVNLMAGDANRVRFCFFFCISAELCIDCTNYIGNLFPIWR